MDESDDTLSVNSDSQRVLLSCNCDPEYSSTKLEDESHSPYDVTEHEEDISVNFLLDILNMLNHCKTHLESFTKSFENLSEVIKTLVAQVSLLIDNEVDIRKATSQNENQLQPKQNSNIENQSMTEGQNSATGMEKKKNRTKLKSVKVEDLEMELHINEDSLNKKRLSKPRLCKTKAVTDESLLKYAILTGRLNKRDKLENVNVEPGTSSGYKLNEVSNSKTMLSKKKVMGVRKSLKNGSPTGMKNKKNRKRIKSVDVENLDVAPGTNARILNMLLNPGKNYANEGMRAADKRKATTRGLDGRIIKRVKKK